MTSLVASVVGERSTVIIRFASANIGLVTATGPTVTAAQVRPARSPPRGGQ